MSCFKPIPAWQLESGDVVFSERGKIARSFMLPCGNCLGCRSDRARAWGARIVHESLMHDFSWFVTLTYDDKSLVSPSLEFLFVALLFAGASHQIASFLLDDPL